jgi:hypothetical protein
MKKLWTRQEINPPSDNFDHNPPSVTVTLELEVGFSCMTSYYGVEHERRGIQL